MPIESDVKNPDGALHVRFQMLTLYQPYDSTNSLLPDGKTPNPGYTGMPVYKDVPHIEIAVPSESGLCLNRIVEPVRNEHKIRFPKIWAIFEQSQGSGDQIIGTKLSEWPGITRSRAEELRAMKYFTVEQLASASDAQVQGLGMDGSTLRRKAQQFIKVAQDSALTERQSAEIQKLREAQESKDKEHAAALKALQDQMAILVAATQAKPAEAKPEAAKRRGRPPKAPTENQPGA